MTGGHQPSWPLTAALLSILLRISTAHIPDSKLAAWNTLRTPDLEAQDWSGWYAAHRRHLLATPGSCACVCAGTHEGYVTTANTSQASQCTGSACVGAFPSCTYGEVDAHFSDGSLPTGPITGTITLQSVSPADCEQAILGYSCSQQYQFSVDSGFIQFISTSSDACPPGSAQQVVSPLTRETQAAGHFTGNVNASAFTLTNTKGCTVMNINQGCTLNYKVISGGPLLGLKAGGKCFPKSATVETPTGVVAMEDLQIGDKVLTVLSSGSVAFQAVFMFSHRDEHATSAFIKLRTASGNSIMASPGHYLWVLRKSAEVESPGLGIVRPNRRRGIDHGFVLSLKEQGAEIVKASEVQVGDILWWHSKATGEMEQTKVRQISPEHAEGLYNPHTLSGTILVNSIAALTFTESLPRSIAAHSLITAPAAALYRVLPSQRIAMWLNDAVLQLLGV